MPREPLPFVSMKRRALWQRLGRRAVGAAVAVCGVLLLVFSLKHLVPGDPIDAMLGQEAQAADRVALQHCLGLDENVWQALARFAASVFDGTLGYTCRNPQVTVATLIWQAFPFTFSLALASVAFALLVAVPLSLLSAWRPHGWFDAGASVFALIGMAVPSLWLGPLLLRLFYVQWHWFPGPADDPRTVAALVLPTLTLGIHMAALLTRLLRSCLFDLTNEDFMRTAIAKGLSRGQALRKHLLRPALLPMVTVAGMQVAGLLGGAIVTERVFGRPGLGTLLLDALAVRDWKVLEGTVLVMALSYVAINLLVDLIYTLVDPRLRSPAAAP